MRGGGGVSASGPCLQLSSLFLKLAVYLKTLSHFVSFGWRRIIFPPKIARGVTAKNSM